MEIGRLAEIDNAKVNNIEKAQKVSNLDEKSKVIQDDQYKKTLGTVDISDKKNGVSAFCLLCESKFALQM